MVMTVVEPGHFFIGEKGVGSVEVFIRDGLAYIYELEGDGHCDLFTLIATIEKVVREHGVTGVMLHTAPDKERVEKVYADRYGFSKLHTVWYRDMTKEDLN